MQTLEHKPIGELVAAHYQMAPIFKKHNIDFCCGGGHTIQEACARKGIDSTALLAELEALLAENNGTSSQDYLSWPLDLLADYIEKKHHRYVETRSRDILPFLEKLCKVHGGRHPELLEINTLFNKAVGALAQHMKKEELVLFPYVRNLVGSERQSQYLSPPPFGTIHNPIEAMMEEHDTEGERFRKIAHLSNNYTPPEDACNTYRVTFAMLKEFEDDLHLHIHLENNILFPKAIALEETMKV